MANRWGKVETVTDFIFLGSKITADGDRSHEIKRCLLLGRKVMTNLDSMGTHVHLWRIHVDLWQKPIQYCKAISLQIKEINLN